MINQGHNHYLLLGAGFTRNWGGWLASEVDEYLLGLSSLNDVVRTQLLDCRAIGGFEKALANLRVNSNTIMEAKSLENALAKMFESMDRSFSNQNFKFEWSNDIKESVSRFLCRFDAIFSLNQDLLLERHYFDNVLLRSSDVGRSWNSCSWPGLEPIQNSSYSPVEATWKPTVWDGKVAPNCQPYIKLHGSSNWRTSDDNRLLIMGENKNAQINGQDLLQSYHKFFCECLSQPNAKLMVIGFSFRDEHIYQAIQAGISKGSLKVFIIDPIGVDVLDKNRAMRGVGVYHRDHGFENMWPSLIGASRRSLREIIANDRVEREKVEMFFN